MTDFQSYPSSETLLNEIRETLKGADLTKLSSKKVRNALELKFSVNLSDRKQEIDNMLMDEITSNQYNILNTGKPYESDSSMFCNVSSTNDDNSFSVGDCSIDTEQNWDTKSTTVNDESSSLNVTPNGVRDSKQSSDESMPKNTSESISAESDSESDRSEENRNLNAIENNFDSKKVNKRMRSADSGIRNRKRQKIPKTKEIVDEGEVDVEPSDDLTDKDLALKLHQLENYPYLRRRSSASKMISKKKQKKTKASGSSDKKKRGYMKELTLTEPLSQFVGGSKMARSEVVRRIYAYCKERDLFDPRDRRFIKCDEKLQHVFGRSRVRAFGMMRQLSKYIYDPDKE